MNSFNPLNSSNTDPVGDMDSRDQIVNDFLGNAYHIVRSVYLKSGLLEELYKLINQYGLTTNVAVKAPVEAVVTENNSLTGNQMISWTGPSGSYETMGTTGMRVLVLNQDDPKQNGIYNIQQREWTRAVDFTGPMAAVDGTLVFSAQGDAWIVSSPTFNVQVGVTPIEFVKIDLFAQEAVQEATQKALEAANSAEAALQSEVASKASEEAAGSSALSAQASEEASATSQAKSKASELAAKASEEAAKISENNSENFANLAESNLVNSRTFASTTEGIAGTPSGEYFRVPAGSTSEYSFIYYKNDGGTAVKVTQTLSKNYVDNRLVPGSYQPQMIPLWHDQEGKVPVWLANGLLDSAGIGPVLAKKLEEIPNKYVPQGDYSPNFFPLVYDKGDKVPLWFHNGLLDAAGVGPVLQAFIKDVIGDGGSTEVVTTGGSFLEGDQYKFTYKKGRIFSGQSVSLNVAFTGDSWTEKSVIPKSLINVLGGTYKDPGWISCSNRGDGTMSGISPVAAVNFTKYDGGSNNTNIPPYGCGPDGNGYYNNNQVGSLTWTGAILTDLSVFYYDGDGQFTIQIDSNAPVTITPTNTKIAKRYDFSGLSATAHTITITSVGNGVVSILGMYGKNNNIPSGITVSRMGNGGAIASDYLNFSSWIAQIAPALDLDMLFVILGTNDFRLSKGLEQYEAGLRSIITQYRAATPGICICLVSPGQCNASGNPGLSEYDKTMRKLAVELNVNFISGYQLFPKVYDNSGGAWEDALHMSPLGAYVLNKKIKDELFKE